MRLARMSIVLGWISLLLTTIAAAQDQPAVDPALPPSPHEKKIHLKHILVVGQTKGFEHDSISDGMVAMANGNTPLCAAPTAMQAMSGTSCVPLLYNKPNGSTRPSSDATMTRLRGSRSVSAPKIGAEMATPSVAAETVIPTPVFEE